MFRNFMTKFGSQYQKALGTHPYGVQAVQVAILMGTGDILAQTVVEKRASWDVPRTAKFAGLGFFLVGPAFRLWFGTLDKIVKIENNVKRTVVKVCVDQLFFAPCFLAVFTTALSTLQGLSWPQIKERLQTDYPTIVKMNYCIWPAAQLFNFGLVPLNYQVVFVQVISILWNIYLSVKLSGKSKSLD